MNTETSKDLDGYRQRARGWLAMQAPGFSGAVRHGLSLDEDVLLGRAWQALKAEHGYAAITLPRQYGGGGGSELQKIIFAEEELRYELPVVYYSISLSNPVPIFLRYATQAFKDRLAPRAIRGDDIWCQLFSEPSAGSDLAALRLKAERKDHGWLLNGQKLWTSWAQLAEWGVIVTRTDASVAKHAGLTYFFLNMKSPGITIRPIRRLVGHPDLNEVYFDSVFVPDEQRLGEVGGGFKVAVETLMIERYGITDETASSPPLEAFVELARRSRINGKPALADGQVRTAIANALVERQGLRAIHKRAMSAIAAGREPGPEGAIRKLLIGRTRQNLGALALDLMGAEGVYLNPDGQSSTDFAHAWLDPSVRIAGGTDEVLLNTLAERVLGLPQDHRPDKGVPFNQLEQ
jgi:alkylation response protein AidB-like acyl-CoA dehydrogenase